MDEVINVQYINFDGPVKESVTKNEDDSYTIFLNARYCKEQLQESYLHALKHIENDDFSKHDVDKIELKAHKKKGA